MATLQRVPISTIIDVGASDGSWSAKAERFLPDARVHLIEAQACHKDGLEKFSALHRNATFTICAASNAPGNLYFDFSGGPYGGLASKEPFPSQDPGDMTPCTSIDAEIARLGLEPPFLIKLDTHGFELPILDGAAAALEKTNALFIECYNFFPGPSGLPFWSLCVRLEALGFRPYDMVEFLHRPRDGFFWQADILFLKSDRPEFADRVWQ